VARTPALGSWPGSEGSGGTKTVPMQCSAMSCGATPMCVARNGCGELPRRRARYKLRWQTLLYHTPNWKSHGLDGVGGWYNPTKCSTLPHSSFLCPAATAAEQKHRQMAFWHGLKILGELPTRPVRPRSGPRCSPISLAFYRHEHIGRSFGWSWQPQNSTSSNI